MINEMVISLSCELVKIILGNENLKFYIHVIVLDIYVEPRMRFDTALIFSILYNVENEHGSCLDACKNTFHIKHL